MNVHLPSNVNVLYSKLIFRASEIKSLSVFLALLSRFFASQNLIDSGPKFLSMFAYMFEISKLQVPLF